jgi:hypothetical protein
MVTGSTTQGSWGIRRIAAAFLILGALACFVAAGMYSQDHGGLARGAAFHTWERGLLATAVILTSIGFLLLEDAFQAPDGRALARIGASGYFFAGIFLVAGEALAFTLGWDKASVLIPVYVVMAYLAQASLGGALLQSRLIAPWIGWATILWNLAWLVALFIVGWVSVGYIPILHHLMPLVIGIALLWKAPKPETSHP